MKYGPILLSALSAATLCAATLCAAEPAIAFDSPDRDAANPARPWNPPESPTVGALTAFTRFSLEPDPVKKSRHLCTALRHDPDSTLALGLLATRTPVAVLRQVAPELTAAALAHPDRLPLALLAQAQEPALAADSPLRGKLAAAVLAAVPAPEKLDSRQLELYFGIVRARLEQLRGTGSAGLAEGDRLIARLRKIPRDNPAVPELAAYWYAGAVQNASANRRWLGLRGSRRTEYEAELCAVAAELAATDEKPGPVNALRRRLMLYHELRMKGHFSELLGRNLSQPEVQLLGAALLLDTRTGLTEAEKRLALACARRTSSRELLIGALLLNRRFHELDSEIAKIKDPSRRRAMRRQMLLFARRFDELRREMDVEEQALADPKLDLKSRAERTEVLWTTRIMLAEELRDVALFRQCEAFYRRVGRLGDPEVANALGYVAAELNVDLDEAEKRIDLALKAQPENGAYLDSKGWVRFRRGDCPAAQKYLESALTRLGADRTSRGVTLEHLGDVLAARREFASARARYREALECPPDSLGIFKIDRVRRKLQELDRR